MLLTSRQRFQLFSRPARLEEHAGISPAQAFTVIGSELLKVGKEAVTPGNVTHHRLKSLSSRQHDPKPDFYQLQPSG